MKIKKLTLKNWCQHESLIIDFTKDTTISGRNQAGKTNILSALTYMADGKNIYNNQVTTDSIMKGKEQAEVTLVFDNDDTFTKTMSEETKCYKYIYNEAEMTKKKFEEKLSGTGYLNARMFIKPLYFAKQMPWKDREQVLFDMFSKVTHEDVLKEASDLKEIIDIYQEKNLNHLEYLVKVRKDRLNLSKKLDEIHIRLKEASLPPGDDLNDRGKIEEEFFKLDEKLKLQREYYKTIYNTAIKDVRCTVCGCDLPKDEKGQMTAKAQGLLTETLNFINTQGKALKERRDALALLLDGSLEHESDGKKTSRIIELEKELKQVSSYIEKKDYYLNMIEKYEAVRVQLAEKQINESFEQVQFKFFEEQKNGEVKRVCKAYNNAGVSAEYWSTGESIKLGMEIIDNLQTAYEVDLPVFIDNFEAITGDINAEQQIVKFVVDDVDGVNINNK